MTERAGFTVMEILVVTAIVAIIAATLLPSLWDSTNQGKVAKAQSEVKQIRQAIDRLQFDTDLYPHGCRATDETDDITITALATEDAGITQQPSDPTATADCSWSDGEPGEWNGPYMETMPEDPWGNNYEFTTNYSACDGAPEGVAVYSKGPDGEMNCDDIVRFLKTETTGDMASFKNHPDN